MRFYKRYSFLIDFSAGFLFLCYVFLLFFIPLNSKKTIWNSYRILFLPISADDRTVLKAAGEEGITGVISVLSSEERFKMFENFTGGKSVITEKERYNQWFLNDQENLQYMYIPINQKISSNFLRFLKKNTEAFYLEDITSFSIFNFAVSLVFFAFVFFCSSKKSFFFTAAFPFVVCLAFQKGILAFSAGILMIYTIAFWTEAVGSYLKFTKEQLIKRIKKNSLLVFLPFVSFIISKFGSNTSLLVFLSAFVAGCSLTYILEKVRFFMLEKDNTEKLHKKIIPYFMNPNSIIKFWESGSLYKVSATTSIFIVVFSFFLYFNFSGTFKADKNILYLPLPNAKNEKSGFTKDSFDSALKIRTGEDLPDLVNFISDSWNMKILPYANLNKDNTGIDHIAVSDFTVNKNGVITEKENVIFKFDDEFVQDVLSARVRPSIEDMLYAQGCFMTAVYSGKKFPLNIYNSAALLVALFSAMMPVTIILLRVFEK